MFNYSRPRSSPAAATQEFQARSTAVAALVISAFIFILLHTADKTAFLWYATDIYGLRERRPKNREELLWGEVVRE